MVSTRGPRPRFHEGESVLCYEPDQSRCLALYDSKILDVGVTRDERGKRVSHYQLHFSGWSKSWDKWVKEDLLLEDSPANRKTQQRLKREMQRMKRKQVNLSEERNTPAVTAASEEKKEKEAEKGSGSTASDNESTGSYHIASLDLPKKLMKVLEEDCCNITQRQKLVRLPQRQTVRKILAGYYETVKYNTVINEDGTLGFVEEMIAGLKTYIDWYLPSQLLYGFERLQNQQMRENCRRQTGGGAVSVAVAAALTQADHSYASSAEERERKGREQEIKVTLADRMTDTEEDIDVVGDGPVKIEPAEDAKTAVSLGPEIRAEEPPPYSDIYGIHHLLRLFVRFPEFIGQTAMPEDNYRNLFQCLRRLIDYLAANYSSIVPGNQYFSPSESYCKEAQLCQ